MEQNKEAKKTALSEDDLKDVTGGCVRITLEHIAEAQNARLTTLETRRGLFGRKWGRRARITTLELAPEEQDRGPDVTLL